MKQVMICLFAVCCFIGASASSFADEKTNKVPDKGVADTIADGAKEVKKGAAQAYQGSQEAIVRDVQQMKEDIPRGVKEIKDSMVQHSEKVKESVSQEFREIREGMSRPLTETKTGNK